MVALQDTITEAKFSRPCPSRPAGGRGRLTGPKEATRTSQSDSANTGNNWNEKRSVVLAELHRQRSDPGNRAGAESGPTRGRVRWPEAAGGGNIRGTHEEGRAAGSARVLQCRRGQTAPGEDALMTFRLVGLMSLVLLGLLVAAWIVGLLALSSLRQLGLWDAILLGLMLGIVEVYVRLRWP